MVRFVDAVTVKGRGEVTRIYAPLRYSSTDEERAWGSYRRGIDHYCNGEFTLAVKYLLAAHKTFPDDTVIRMFLLRCSRLIKNPPGSDWTGVVALAEK